MTQQAVAFDWGLHISGTVTVNSRRPLAMAAHPGRACGHGVSACLRSLSDKDWPWCCRNSRLVGGSYDAWISLLYIIAGEDIECADDQEAIKKETQAAKSSVIELWERDRSSDCCLLRRRIGNLPSVASDEP